MNEKSKPKFYLACAFVLSLLFHFALIIRIDFKLPFSDPNEQTVEWIILKEPEKKIEPKIHQEKKFTSDKNRKVKKETRFHQNAHDDNFRKMIIPGANNVNPVAHKKITDEEFDPKEVNKKDISLEEKINNAIVIKPRSPLPEPNTLEQTLPEDIEIGDAVVLNTNRNLYYSFFSRTLRNIQWPWVENVISGFKRLKPEQLRGAPKKWVTVLDVTLTPDGQLVSTAPMRLTGFWEIDEAPVRALEEIKRFPNPPAGMIGEDGMIHIKFQFTVFYDPK